jgi:hypothetical protein
MKITSIIDEKKQCLVIDYTIMADGTYLCAIKGYVEPVQKTKAGTMIRSDLGIGIARTRYYALHDAEAAFYKRYEADEKGKLIEKHLQEQS